MKRCFMVNFYRWKFFSKRIFVFHHSECFRQISLLPVERGRFSEVRPLFTKCARNSSLDRKISFVLGTFVPRIKEMLIANQLRIFLRMHMYKNVSEIALRRYSAGREGVKGRVRCSPLFSYATIDPLMGYYDIAKLSLWLNKYWR